MACRDCLISLQPGTLLHSIFGLQPGFSLNLQLLSDAQCLAGCLHTPGPAGLAHASAAVLVPPHRAQALSAPVSPSLCSGFHSAFVFLTGSCAADNSTKVRETKIGPRAPGAYWPPAVRPHGPSAAVSASFSQLHILAYPPDFAYRRHVWLDASRLCSRLEPAHVSSLSSRLS